jgi:hypothetical protein
VGPTGDRRRPSNQHRDNDAYLEGHAVQEILAAILAGDTTSQVVAHCLSVELHDAAGQATPRRTPQPTPRQSRHPLPRPTEGLGVRNHELRARHLPAIMRFAGR